MKLRISLLLFLIATNSYALEFVAFTERPGGRIEAHRDYTEVVPKLGKGDVIIFRGLHGDIRYPIAQMGRIGGEKYSEIFDIGNGKVLRLNKDPKVNAIPSFVKSASLLREHGVPVVNVYTEGKLGNTSVFLEVSYEKGLMTLREIGLGLGANFGPQGNRSNMAMQMRNLQLAGKVGTIGGERIKAAFLDFVRKVAPFTDIDDLHPDNLVLIEKEGGGLEFKVWDIGTDAPSRTRVITPQESTTRRSFLDEPRMKAMVDGPFRDWMDEVRTSLQEHRTQYLRSLSCDGAYPQ